MSLMTFRPMSRATLPVSLEINRHYEKMLSPLTLGELEVLVDAAGYAKQAGAGAAFLIAFDQDAAYEGENFAWFKARYDRFIYVDRIAIGAALQGQGLARAFYGDLTGFAWASGAAHLCAEVNIAPPNPASHAFHRKMGFNRVGEAQVDAKRVQYYVKDL